MTPRILLTGKTGQVGNELSKCLSPMGELAAPDRCELDLSNASDISRVVSAFAPHLIVNAAAYTAVDQAEREPEIARALNADAPATLAAEARRIGACLVHYSTDYVFDGRKGTPYLETDPTNPVGVYGKTKLAGENAIRRSGCAHLIFRTAWVYATRGRNFLLTILRLASQREELRIVNDQIGAPTSAAEIARVTASILKTGFHETGFSLSQFAGTYHMTASGSCSWYDFARAILEEASRLPSSDPWLSRALQGKILIAKRTIPISTSEYPALAKRPPYSVLSNQLLAKTFHTELRDWREQLKAAIGERNTGT
jgi:dTDP-4-dehydrorhamnose reductase